MRKIWVAIGAAGLAVPGLARDAASSKASLRRVELRRPAGGVLVAESPPGYKQQQEHKRGAPVAKPNTIKAAPKEGGKTSLKVPVKKELSPTIKWVPE